MEEEILQVFTTLKKEASSWQVPVIELIEAQTKDPFKVLVATVMSARTKDEVTALASRKLFSKVTGVEELRDISILELQKLIYPVGFYKTKAKHLKQLAVKLIDEFAGEVPQTIDELLTLPGVGRKTANLVLAAGFGIPALCIDTHCHRIPQRLGWHVSKTPYESEMKLRSMLPKRIWLDFNWVFVAFGQNICKPVKPQCYRCPVEQYCRFEQKNLGSPD